MPVRGHKWGVLVRRPLSVIDVPLKKQIWRFSGAIVLLLVLGLALVVLVRRSYARAGSLAKSLYSALKKESAIRQKYELLHRQMSDIANTLQRDLLPPKTPSFSGWQFGSCYKSATSKALIGGDFFDFLELAGGKLAVIIGDVAGRGIQATSIAALAKNTLRAFMLEESDLEQVVSRANAIISKSVDPGRFITAFIGILDEDGRLRYINCGHTEPFIFAPPDRITTLDNASMPLGLGAAFVCSRENTITLNEAETLLLYTDGLTETRRDRDFYGEERLKNWLIANRDIPPGKIPDALCGEIQEFSQNKLADDLAIVAIRKDAGVPAAAANRV